METKKLGRTGIEVGVIGFGCEGFSGKTQAECNEMIAFAVQNGINYYDMYTSDPDIRKHVAVGLSGFPRDSYHVQGHVCSIWKDGQYCRTRKLSEVKSGFESLLSDMALEYIDVGMIHYVDDLADYSEVLSGGVLDYCKELKQKGRIKHIGISTHNTDIAKLAAQSGVIDVIMFSVNPAYDMLPPIDDVEKLFESDTFNRTYKGIDQKREELYALCQNLGVAITVMKCFAGGLLLDETQTPFGKPLTVTQCLSYCLTRPSVATVLSGMSSLEEIAECLKYTTATSREKDFSEVLSGAPDSAFVGHCMYCGHCAPCTAKIDIAAVNKFYDLAAAQGKLTETVREHYEVLEHHAEECVGCGRCMRNCPFGVDIIKKMQEALELFGK